MTFELPSLDQKHYFVSSLIKFLDIKKWTYRGGEGEWGRGISIIFSKSFPILEI
jgi:hypothetical protein